MTSKQKYSILFTLGGLSALAPLSIDMYLPAFPKIAQALCTDIAHVSYSLTAYFIGISLGQLIYGPICDRFGRRKPLLTGLALFLIAAIGCAASPSVIWLIVFRFVLALGGCAAMVTCTAAINDFFPKSEGAKIFSILMLILGIAPIVGPTLGGAILAVWNWQSIFYFLTFFGVLLIVLVYFFLPEPHYMNTGKRFTCKVIISGYKHVLEKSDFLLYALVTATAISGMFAYISGSPFVFIKFFKFTEVQYSFIFAFNAFGFIIGSQLNRLILRNYVPSRIIHLAGALILIVSLGLIAVLALDAVLPEVLIAIIFTYLFALGFIIPNSAAMAISNFTENTGIASALIGAFQMILSALSSWMVNFLFDGSITPTVIGILCPSLLCASIIYILKQRNIGIKSVSS